MSTLTLIGPQRQHHTLSGVVDRLGLSGRLAAITAGWQEREGEIEEMREHLSLPVVDLRLHHRLEVAFAEDSGLFRAHRARQDQLREMHQLYRYRLDFILEPARELLRREGNPKLLEPERESALAAVRELDRQYLGRIVEVHRAFEQAHPPGTHPALERQCDEIAALLESCVGVLIAGGHVASLLNRLRLFRIADLASAKPIVAWSAGAMALAERVVLFHDSPPQGAGNAEVLDVGLGRYSGLLPLPHAQRRLQLQDPFRVALFARRFAPDICLPLDGGEAITLGGEHWRELHSSGTRGARQLTVEGRVEELAA